MTDIRGLLGETQAQLAMLQRRQNCLAAVNHAYQALETQGLLVKSEICVIDGCDVARLSILLPNGPALHLPAPETLENVAPGSAGDAVPAPEKASAPAPDAAPEGNLVRDRVGNLIDQGLAGVPWSDAEIRQARVILRRGGTVQEVGAALRRQYDNAVKNCRPIRDALEAEPEEGPERREEPEEGPERREEPEEEPGLELPAEAADVAPAAVHPPAARPQPALDMPATSQGAAIRIGKLTRTQIWSPETDLEMFEMLMSGSKAQDVATILETTKAEVVGRFRAICPDPTPAAQAQCVHLLRERANAAEVSG